MSGRRGVPAAAAPQQIEWDWRESTVQCSFFFRLMVKPTRSWRARKELLEIVWNVAVCIVTGRRRRGEKRDGTGWPKR